MDLESQSLFPGGGGDSVSSPPLLAQLTDKAVRGQFVRKVYSIVFFQLLLTAAIALPFNWDVKTAAWTARSPWLMVLSLAMTVGMLLIFSCQPQLMRQFPTNYLIIGAFTVAEGVMVGTITAQYKTASVLIALCLVSLLVLALTCYSWKTQSDFTGLGPYLFVGALSLLLGGIVMAFVGGPVGHKIFAVFGACLFSLYLVYDTQLILGGGHRKMSFSIDDYCMAALALYVDIIQLFLYILRIMGERRDR